MFIFFSCVLLISFVFAIDLCVWRIRPFKLTSNLKLELELPSHCRSSKTLVFLNGDGHGIKECYN